MNQLPSRDVSNEVARINRNLFIKRVTRSKALDLIINTAIVLVITLAIAGVVDAVARAF